MDAVTYALAGQALAENAKEFRHWKQLPDIPVPIHGHTATKLNDDRVLVAGGRSRTSSSSEVPLSSVYLFDPVTQTWTAKASLPATRWFHCAAPLSGGRVLVAGGYVASTPGAQSTAYVYDINANAWTARADMLEDRADVAGAALSGDRVLVAGGWYDGSGTDNDTEHITSEMYDDATNTWVYRANMQSARLASKAVSVSGDRVVLVGGDPDHNDQPNIYTHATNTWSYGSYIWDDCMYPAVAALSRDRVLIVAGSHYGDAANRRTHGNFFIYDVPANKMYTCEGYWSDFSAALERPEAVALSGDRILATGGVKNSGYTADGTSGVWLYSDVNQAVSDALATMQAWAATR